VPARIGPVVAELLAAFFVGGMSEAEIAAEKGRSPKTVSLYFASALRKLGAKSKPHAMILALQAGVIKLDNL